MLCTHCILVFVDVGIDISSCFCLMELADSKWLACEEVTKSIKLTFHPKGYANPSQERTERHRGSVYNEVIFSPDYICKPRWLWREDEKGFLTPRFRRCPKAHVGRPILLLWNDMDRDVWLAEMALKDATITFCWMTCMSGVGLGASLIVDDLQLAHDMLSVLVAGALFAVLPAFLCLASWMGGACWNITSLIAFAYMGDSYCSRHTVVSILVRMMAQMVAAMWAAVFIIRFVPPEYRHLVGGPQLQVDPIKGALVEGILTFILILVSLMTMLRGPKNPRARQLISVSATVMLVILGGSYTGPSMNPTNIYGWAVVNERNESWEHYAVYWFGPLVGALAAVKTVKLLLGPISSSKNN